MSGCDVEVNQSDRSNIRGLEESIYEPGTDRFQGIPPPSTQLNSGWEIRLWSRRDLAKAIQDLDKVLWVSQQNTTNNQYTSILNFIERDPKHVMDDLNAFISSNSNNGFAFYLRGGLYFEIGEYGKAISDLSRSLELIPATMLSPNTKAYAVLYGMRGHAFLVSGNVDEALSDLTRAIEADPNDEILFIDRGTAYSLKRESRKALADLDAAVRLSPTNAFAFYNRATILLDLQEVDGAIQDYTKVLSIEPTHVDSLYNRAIAFSISGQLDYALTDVDQALEIEPRDETLFALRGYLHCLKGNLDQAIDNYREAIQLSPAVPTYYYNRGMIFLRKNQWDKARLDLKDAFRLDPNNAEIANELAWLLATCPDDSIRDGAQAVLVAEKACNLVNWSNWNYIGTLAAAFAETGNYDQAVNLQERVLDMNGLTKLQRLEEERRLKHFKEDKPYRINSEVLAPTNAAAIPKD